MTNATSTTQSVQPKQPRKISGEDIMFLMEASMATAYGGDAMAKFLLDRANIDRLLAIREAVGETAFNAEIVKLKDIMTSLSKEIVREKL